jgi:F0F1-type ATP synthase alpha subunit
MTVIWTTNHGPTQFVELDWREYNLPIGKAMLGRLVDADRQFCATGEAVKLQMESAASHELSYHPTKRRSSIYMLCSGNAKVNPTGIESIDHLRPRRRPPLRHPL